MNGQQSAAYAPCPERPTGGRVGRVVKGDNGVLYVFPSDDSDSHLQLKNQSRKP